MKKKSRNDLIKYRMKLARETFHSVSTLNEN